MFFVAARGHHTDVGGLTPGSMPPHSREIEDEGVYIDNFKLKTEALQQRNAEERLRREKNILRGINPNTGRPFI